MQSPPWKRSTTTIRALRGDNSSTDKGEFVEVDNASADLGQKSRGGEIIINVLRKIWKI